jgi:exopolysaccharide production protein ExoQ
VYILAAIRLLTLHEKAAALFKRSVVLWAFVGLMLASVLWSVNALVTFKDAVELAGTTLVACYLVTRYPLSRMLELFATAFAALCALSYALIAFVPRRGRIDYGHGAWWGIFAEKNALGAAMVLALITFTVLLLSGSSRQRLWAAAGWIAAAGLLAGSQSATAFAAGAVALTVGVAALLWRSPRGPAVWWRAAIVIAGLVVAGAAILFGVQPDLIAHSLGRGATFTGRTDFWPSLVQAIGDQPLLGYGYDAFFRSGGDLHYLAAYAEQAGGWTPYHAHDSFLQIALDAGLVGVVLLIVLLVVTFARALRYLASEPGAGAVWPLMIVLYLVAASYTESSLGNYNTLEWVFFVAAFLYPVRVRLRLAARSRDRNVKAASWHTVRHHP